jgi:cyclophilin family peptidyl-prolyl cis-trans isomerase
MRLTAAACALMLFLARPQEPVSPFATEPSQVLAAEKAWAGAEVLWPMARGGDAGTSPAAIRAIGRLEDPRQVPSLFALGSRSRRVVADAVAQSLKGFDPAVDPDLIARSFGTLYQAGLQPVGSRDQLEAAAASVGAIGRIAYSTPEQVHGAEEVLRRISARTGSESELIGYRHDVMRSFESLARANSKVTGFDEESNKLLAAVVQHSSANDDASSRLYAFGALMAGGGLDADVEQAALKDDYWQIRRLATAALGGGGGGLDTGARADALAARLSDRNAQVRYEAVRAYLRRGVQTGGCAPLVNALSDDDLDVVLAALDGLGDACKDDEDITTRLIAEARVPPSTLNWHREAHAFVALAKRSPERGAISMEGFATYPEPWVRMYAARAAAAMGDLVRLEKLAYDVNDNVREAALEPLRRLKSPNAQAALVAGLDRGYQVVRIAAIMLKALPHDTRLFRPLMNSLLRVTKDQSDTSRDARLPLLDAIAVHGEGDDATELLPLLRDFDPKIAERAAQVAIALSGKVALPDPVPVVRGWSQAFTDLRRCVSVSLASGGRFRMRMTPEAAPIAVDRFLKLASDHYYDGLTIHRVVPNFVIQGGSPGANEYVGHKEYMRDEVGGLNTFGTVGLSTRGRNTGDAQFFVNLVDNPRLDYDYTIFAVVPERDMDVVNKIQEGEVMRSITLVPKGNTRGDGCSN